MSQLPDHEADNSLIKLAELVYQIPAGRRGGVLQAVARFEPSPTLEESFAIGPLRAAFADVWEAHTGKPVSIASLRLVLWPPLRLEISLAFHRLVTTRTIEDIETVLVDIVSHLHRRAEQIWTVSSSASVGNRSKRFQG